MIALNLLVQTIVLTMEIVLAQTNALVNQDIQEVTVVK